MALAGCRDVVVAGKAQERVRTDAAARFAVDLILRALLWVKPLELARTDDWERALRDTSERSLLAVLSSGELRSHPTELIARHAGELLLRSRGSEAAEPWFALSRAICLDAPGDSELRRCALFTERLQKEPSLQAGPLGSVMNPSFEYR